MIDLSDELTQQIVDKILKDNPHVKLGEPMVAPLMNLTPNSFEPKIVTAKQYTFSFSDTKKLVLPQNVKELHFHKILSDVKQSLTPDGGSVSFTHPIGSDEYHITFGVS